MKTKTTKLFYCVLLFVSFAVGKANAQMVYLPDTNFRNELISQSYGPAISGDSIDASHSLVINTTTLGFGTGGINDLTGISAFVNLQHLTCMVGQLTFLPQLPSNLLTLDCQFNNLTSLPNLPATLTHLICNDNNITSLPILPSGLIHLDCYYNQLTMLPPLPTTLQYLNCYNNQLSALPSLPSSLSHLECDYNQLTSLPALPNPYYDLISCENNLLTLLPDLPDSLEKLDCSYNQLTALPTLPTTLTHLYCDGNTNLTCLPKLHSMNQFLFQGTAITCIPNYANIVTCLPPLNSLPICDMFNNNGCDFYWNISGLIYSDSNANCVYDGADYTIKNIPLQLLSNGNLIQQTNFPGKYSFATDTSGVYQVRVDTNDLPFDVICPVSNLYSDTITSIDSLKAGRDFSLECKSGLHVGIKSIYADAFVPARFSTVNIHVEDLTLFYGMQCASGESGGVTVKLDGPVTYISPAPGALTPTTVSGNLLTYIVPDFGALYIGAFDIIVQTDTFATIGTQVCITVTTITTNTSSNIKKDSLHQCFTIVGSYDPNDKQVSPVSDININGDGWLIYTINFQNTGTAQAYDIYLLDTLDNNLDWSTFKLTAYSHQPQVQLFNTGILRFNFPNINLPDSNTNEPLSHGYVQYKVKLKPGLSVGTQIYNTAYIYFDFNQPVVTNTTQNVLVPPTAIAEIKNETEFNVFPNPVHDVLYVSIKKSSTSNPLMSLTDMQGRVIKEEKILNNNSSVIPIDVSTLSQGFYLLKMNGQVQRFVKM